MKKFHRAESGFTGSSGRTSYNNLNIVFTIFSVAELIQSLAHWVEPGNISGAQLCWRPVCPRNSISSCISPVQLEECRELFFWCIHNYDKKFEIKGKNIIKFKINWFVFVCCQVCCFQLTWRIKKCILRYQRYSRWSALLWVLIDFYPIYLFSLSVSLYINRMSVLLGCMSFGVRSLMEPDKVSSNAEITGTTIFCKQCP